MNVYGAWFANNMIPFLLLLGQTQSSLHIRGIPMSHPVRVRTGIGEIQGALGSLATDFSVQVKKILSDKFKVKAE